MRITMFNNLLLKIMLGALSTSIIILTGACNNGNITSPTPSANETTYHGIIISTLVESPWPEVPVYRYPREGNIIKIGDEVSIGLDVTPRLGEYWKASFDRDNLTLEEEQVIYLEPLSPVNGTAWFRFKADKEGDTSINFELISVGNITTMSFIFNFFITE